jgi:hypothetical protein
MIAAAALFLIAASLSTRSVTGIVGSLYGFGNLFA